MLDGRERSLPTVDPALARALSDRRTGIGCDQLIVLGPSSVADFAMRTFNPDGGEVEVCGNASRAVGLHHGRAATIETAAGVLQVSPAQGGIAVDMGVPRFEWDAIPLAYALDTLTMPVGWDELGGPVAVNVGNPHVVFFVEDCDAVPLERLGPEIEHGPLFPQRINVNVATVTGRGSIRLRVWERGTGLARACGTGACATAVAAMRRGLTDRRVTVTLPGGDLAIEWQDDDRILMTGPATEAFRGSFDMTDYA